MSLKTLAKVTGGQLLGPKGDFAGVAIDSRAVTQGQLFVALAGSQVDGHDYVNQARANGAAVALVERPVESSLPQVVCDSCVEALGKLAKFWRKRWSGQLVMITGSNGKTTVKNLLASILSQTAPCLATRGNFNNEIGLPLTLFELESRHQFAVLEAGAGKPGDIRYLAKIGQPDIGIITNVGPAHLAFFGDLGSVAATKGELLQDLKPNASAVLNQDDAFLDFWRGKCADQRVITFGKGGNADVSLSEGEGGQQLRLPNGTSMVQLPLPGEHNLANAAAAAAAASLLGCDAETIATGLQAVSPEQGRLQFHEVAEFCLIDDSYNANPGSVKAAISVLVDQPGESWLVMGDMLELGDQSAQMHRRCGEIAREQAVDRVFTCGELAANASQGFGEGAAHFDSQASLISSLKANIRPGVYCLVKGSRGANMQHVVSALLETELESLEVGI